MRIFLRMSGCPLLLLKCNKLFSNVDIEIPTSIQQKEKPSVQQVYSSRRKSSKSQATAIQTDDVIVFSSSRSSLLETQNAELTAKVKDQQEELDTLKATCSTQQALIEQLQQEILSLKSSPVNATKIGEIRIRTLMGMMSKNMIRGVWIN